MSLCSPWWKSAFLQTHISSRLPFQMFRFVFQLFHIIIFANIHITILTNISKPVLNLKSLEVEDSGAQQGPVQHDRTPWMYFIIWVLCAIFYHVCFARLFFHVCSERLFLHAWYLSLSQILLKQRPALKGLCAPHKKIFWRSGPCHVRGICKCFNTTRSVFFKCFHTCRQQRGQHWNVCRKKSGKLKRGPFCQRFQALRCSLAMSADACKALNKS